MRTSLLYRALLVAGQIIVAVILLTPSVALIMGVRAGWNFTRFKRDNPAAALGHNWNQEYGIPGASYVPDGYPPLYFATSAAAASVLGLSYLPLRLVSLVSSLA